MKIRIEQSYIKKIIAMIICLAVMPHIGQAQTITVEELLRRAETSGMDQAQINELQNRAQSRGLSDQQFVELLEPAVSLAENNLPSDMIIQKALEGLSKGVPAERMMPVLSNMQNATQQASPMIDDWIKRAEIRQMLSRSSGGMSKQRFRNEMIKATSKGLMTNIPQQEMQNLLNEVGEQNLLSTIQPSDAIVSVGVFTELPTTAEQPEVSRSFVVRSLKGGFKTSDLQRLPAAMKIAQQRSQLPAASVIEGVARQMRGGIPAQKILQNLFNGNVGGGPPGGTPPGLENKQNRGNNGNNGNRG